MAGGLLEGIFEAKNKLHHSYPVYRGISNFDLERKHFFYGKMDKQGDIVIMDTRYLTGVEGSKNSSHFLMDFVKDAYVSFKNNFRKAYKANFARDSVFYRKLKVHKSWDYADLDYNYELHINALYGNFVDKYLASNRRDEKIKNYKDFVREFLRYVLRICVHYPITRTGYIASSHCSPFVSGLMLEIAAEQHGVENNKNIVTYISDPYYDLWARTAAKFGFIVDQNAPWRLVFNVASGALHGGGGSQFMNRRGITYDNLFQYRYTKTYKSDAFHLQNTLLSLYDSFYRQFSTYEKEEFQFDKNGRCHRTKVTHERIEREPPPRMQIGRRYPVSVLGTEGEDEYWLKILLKLRMVETRLEHTPENFEAHNKDMIEHFRIFGFDSALKYINDLTKGFYVTNFNMKGAYWHGVSNFEYRERRRKALEKVENIGHVQYSLVGTGNSGK